MEIKELFEIECNVDDMTGEAVSFATERLFAAGALDVYTVAVGMKKSRPGILIRATCAAGERDSVLGAMFKFTTTLGVRERRITGYVMQKKIENAETELGTVRRKTSCGFGVTREKYEYDDVAKIARERELSIADTIVLLEKSK